MQNSDFRTRTQVSMGSRPHLSFCACKTAWLAPELLVSVGPSPHLWFLLAKHWLLDQHTSLNGFQTSPVVLCMQNIVISTRIKWLYCLQPSPVVLCMQNIVISTRIKRLYCLQPSPVVLCMQNSDFRTRITSLCGSKTLPVVFACKTATSGPE